MCVDELKRRLAERLGAPPAKPGAVILTRDVRSWGVNYLKQIVNDQLREKVDSRGKRKMEWQPTTRSIGVDTWDCEVYGEGLAEMLARRWSPRQPWNAAVWLKRLRRDAPRLDSRGVAPI